MRLAASHDVGLKVKICGTRQRSCGDNWDGYLAMCLLPTLIFVSRDLFYCSRYCSPTLDTSKLDEMIMINLKRLFPIYLGGGTETTHVN